MKAWQGEADIMAPIDKVWHIIDGNEETLRKLDPHIISSKTLCKTPEVIGSKYDQVYRDGNKELHCTVTVIDYDQSDGLIRFTVEFTLGDMYDITEGYELRQIDENTTHIIYRTTNQPIGLKAKMLMKLMKNDGVVEQHIKIIKQLAEAQQH